LIIIARMKKKVKKNLPIDQRFKKAEPFLKYWKRSSELQNYFQKENEIKNSHSIEISKESFLNGKLSAEELRRLPSCTSIILSPLRFKKNS
jgi:hypothetical protein